MYLRAALIMDKEVHYSSCWEDYEVIAQTLEPKSKAVVVSSSGYGLFTSMMNEPSRLVGVDTNPWQNSLVKLKLEAIRLFEYEKLLSFLGHSNLSPGVAEMKNRIRECKEALTEDELRFFYSCDLRRGINGIGKFEIYLDTFRKYGLPLFLSSRVLKDFTEAPDLETQERIYRKHVDRFIYNKIFNLYFGKHWLKFRGRQPQMMAHLKEDPARHFKKRMERAWFQIPFGQNPFFQKMLKGKEDRKCIPIPFRKENIDRLKQGQLELINMEYGAYVRSSDEDWDFFYLSDICEGMTAEESDSLFEICASKSKPGARLVIVNNLLSRKPKESQGWKLDEELSNELWDKRLTSFYGFLGVYNRV